MYGLNVSYNHRHINGTKVHGRNLLNAAMYGGETVRP
jgi:hypothetical protein